MKKALIVATDNRFWLNRLGSNGRILTMIQHLQARGWQVQVAFMGHADPMDLARCERLDLPICHSLPPLPAPLAQAAATKAVNLLSGAQLRRHLRRCYRWLRAAATQFHRPRPAGAWWRELALRAQARTPSDFADPRHLALLQRLCLELRPQAVLVEYVHLAWLAEVVPAGVLRLIDTHDVQHERQQRFHAVGESHDLDISEAEEARLLQAFDIVIAIQSRDARLLACMLPNRRVITVMHPQPLHRPRAALADTLDVGFIGSRMAPNVRAARELLQQIWPQVHAGSQGRARLLIAGSVCDALGSDPLPPGAVLNGFVDDLDAYYDGLALMVNPVRLGGGLKIKNIEALCRGKALLTTMLGAEGLEDGVGSAFVVEDSQDAFAGQLLALLLDPARRQALGMQAFAYAQARFRADLVYQPLDDVLDRTLAATSSPADSG